MIKNTNPGKKISFIKYLITLLLAASIISTSPGIYAYAAELSPAEIALEGADANAESVPAQEIVEAPADALPAEPDADVPTIAESPADALPPEDGVEAPAGDILLSEQASEYVTIKVYDRNTNLFGPISLTEDSAFPTDASREMRISGSGDSSNNIRIETIKWYKKDSYNYYWENTTGKFSAGTWRCEMLLNGVSGSNIYNPSTAVGNIVFQGFPDSTVWTGDGNSSGRITFRTTFTIEGKEEIHNINLIGDEFENYPMLGKKISSCFPDIALDNEMISKGLSIDEFNYIKLPGNMEAPVSDGTLADPEGIFELANYCLTVKISLNSSDYKFGSYINVYMNGYSGNCEDLKIDDETVLIIYRIPVIAIKDAFLYVATDSVNHFAALEDIGFEDEVGKDIVIPETIHIRGVKYNVKGIYGAFEEESGFVESVYIPAEINDISSYTFYNCTGLKTAAFEEGSKLSFIPNNCFDSCTSLKEICLPEQIKTIEDHAFHYCRELEKIVIPASVKTIESMAFYDCESLKDVYFTGTKTQWKNINIGEYNNVLLSANIHYNCKSIGGCSVSIDDVTYNGNAQKPAPVLKYNGQTLKAGTDYTVSYKNNKNPGRAQAIIKGKGKYSGTLIKPFKINYKDVPSSHGYATGVYWASDKGIAAGYTGSRAGTFGVKDDITRGQVVTFLWRAAGKPEPSTEKQLFTDVPANHSFYKAIQWAAETGIAGGYSGSRKGQFGPSDNCTRGQIAMFLWRYLGKPEPLRTEQSFTDVPTDHKFYKGIQWAYEWKVTAGNSDGSFGINKTCNRGSCVTFLYRMPDIFYFTEL